MAAVGKKNSKIQLIFKKKIKKKSYQFKFLASEIRSTNMDKTCGV